MSKKRLGKKLGVVVALSLLLGLGNVPNVSSAKALENDKSFEMLKDWYEDYKVNGNEVVTGDETETGGAVNHAAVTFYTGDVIFVVTERSRTNVAVDKVSIGYRAKKQRKYGDYYYGFVTCGHCIRDSWDSRVYGNLTNAKNGTGPIGYILQSVYNGEVDASFVRMADGYRVERKTKKGTWVYPNVQKVKPGDKVSMCGGMSGNITNKKILAVDTFNRSIYDTTREEYRMFDGLMTTEKMGKAGDSGSAVYYMSSGKPYIVGIYIGADSRYGIGYVVPAGKINKALGVTPY